MCKENIFKIDFHHSTNVPVTAVFPIQDETPEFSFLRERKSRSPYSTPATPVSRYTPFKLTFYVKIFMCIR